MNNFLQGSLVPLLLFGFVRASNDQATDYEIFKQGAATEYAAGHLTQAEEFLGKALEAAEHGRDEYSIATTLCNLGNIYQSEDRLGDAEQAYANALRIFTRLSRQSEAVAVLLNLGKTHSLRGRHVEALETLNRAWKMNEKNTTNGETVSAQILNSMGMAHLRRGKTKKAEVLLNEARAKRRHRTGDSDPIDAEILNNLGAVYQRQHRYQDAEKSYEQVIKITEQQLGSAHPDLPLTLVNLGALYTEMGRYTEAAEQYRRGLLILKQMSPVPHAQIARVYREISKMYLKKGDKTSAESTLASAVDSARRNPILDAEFPELLEKYADLLETSGKIREAQVLRTEARRTRTALALVVHVPKAQE